MLRASFLLLAKPTVGRSAAAAAISSAAKQAAAAANTTASASVRPQAAAPTPTVPAAAAAAVQAPPLPEAREEEPVATSTTVAKKKKKKIVKKKKAAQAHAQAPAAAADAVETPAAAEEEPVAPPAATTVQSKAREVRMEAKKAEVARNEARGTATVDDAAAAAPDTDGKSKTAMVKGFRMDEVLSLCGPGDALFARRLPAGGCQFFAWPGTSLQVASRAITSMPDTIRTVHAVFGRLDTPMDIVLDIDCAVPQEHWTMSKVRPFQMKVLEDTLSVVKEEIEKAGEKIETQVVLQSPNLKKASFHVHIKLKDAAFADYRSVHGFLARFSDRIPYADMQIYRPNGMLRMHSCMKENRTSAMVVFDDPKWQLGFPGGKVPEEAAALHSVCVREPGTFKRVLRYEPPRVMNSYVAKGDGAAADGADGEVKFVTVPLPRTEREAVATASRWLRMATEKEVGEWRSWIALGLAAFRVAHHFKDTKGLPRPAMEEMLDAWGTASRACPLKFKYGDCEARWATFDINRMRNASDSDWWQAYKRLGHLEKAKEEILAEQEAVTNSFKKKFEARRRATLQRGKEE